MKRFERTHGGVVRRKLQCFLVAWRWEVFAGGRRVDVGWCWELKMAARLSKHWAAMRVFGLSRGWLS
jgi:hypothetical protein